MQRRAGGGEFELTANNLQLNNLDRPLKLHSSTNSEFYTVGIVIPSALAAALMIGAVAASRELLQWTMVAPLRLLGRISYSLYLVHWPVFYVCALLAIICRPIVPTHTWGNLVVTVTSAIVAIGLAALSYRFVEAPSIRAGKSVVHVLARTWPRIGRPQAEAAEAAAGPGKSSEAFEGDIEGDGREGAEAHRHMRKNGRANRNFRESVG
jgi:hypothetical protein